MNSPKHMIHDSSIERMSESPVNGLKNMIVALRVLSSKWSEECNSSIER